ncbi:MAG: ATP-binding protein [Desulfobacterales bacterium]|jgi:serine/threonine-protein kinase RsbW
MNQEHEMIRMVDSETVEVCIPSEMGYERIAMDCSAAFARMAGFDPSRIEDLKTAVSEACINAIEHGNKDISNARVVVTISYDGESFAVEVMDQGAGIAEMPEEPDIDRKIQKLEKSRGLGLFLIKQLTDQVEFCKKGDTGHAVRMVLQMKGEPKQTDCKSA